MKRIAFIIDSRQAADFITAGIALDEAFCLCPSAAYNMRKAGYVTASAADTYTSLSHAKTALYTADALEKIIACGKDAYGLNDGEISGFRANILYILNWACYLYFSTRHYRAVDAEFYFYSAGKIEKYISYDTAFSALLAATSRRYNHTYENTSYSWPHYYIAQACNAVTLALSGDKGKLRVLHFGDSALKKIEQALWKETKNIVVFKPRTTGKTIAQTLYITLCNAKKILRDPQAHLHYFRSVKPSSYKRDYTAETKQFAQRILAADITFPHITFMERIVSDSGWYMPFYKAQQQVGANLAREISPHLAMTNKGKYHFIRSAIYHMPKEKAASILINHGTHTAQPQGSISQVAANLWASDDRICLKNVSYVVPKSPLTLTQVKEIYGAEAPEFIVLPTVKTITRRFGDPMKIFKIVFAGNYFGPLYHIPWCAETADEYLLNLLELIEKIGAMERVEFIVKLKARKASTHVKILQEKIDALQLNDKIRIDTETKFLDVLEDSHLVISNLSTTIEETLANRVPLLLHTHRKHYFHVPCSFTPPKDGSAGLAYGIKPGQEPGVMINAIRAHYAEIISDCNAASPALWRENQYNNLQEFARTITKLASR